MTNEEAIKHITTWLYAAPDLPPMQVVQAFELAVSALRAGGKDKDVPTMPAGQPLTLEQLRGMDWQPVWIMESPDWGHWELSEDAEDYLAGRDTSLYGITYPDHDCKGGVHQLRWIAYAYPPAHIDREAWTSEWINSMPALGAGDLETRCKSCGNLVLFETDFCPYCGKAMTEEAWEELEKRLRGVKYHGA